MRTEKVGGYTLEIYDSIEDMPARRFNAFNRYLMLDAGIGSDLSTVNEHIHKIEAFLANGKQDLAKRQLKNLRQSLFQVVEGMNLKHLSFIVLIKSINGKPMNDLSDDNIKFLYDKLNCASKSWFDKLVDYLKKKVETELKQYFPEYINIAVENEYFSKMKHRAKLQLYTILKDEDNYDKIREIDNFLYTLVKPIRIEGRESLEVKNIKDFEEMALMLREGLNFEVTDETTVVQMYTALQRLKKKYKANPVRNGRRAVKI